MGKQRNKSVYIVGKFSLKCKTEQTNSLFISDNWNKRKVMLKIKHLNKGDWK